MKDASTIAVSGHEQDRSGTEPRETARGRHARPLRACASVRSCLDMPCLVHGGGPWDLDLVRGRELPVFTSGKVSKSLNTLSGRIRP